MRRSLLVGLSALVVLTGCPSRSNPPPRLATEVQVAAAVSAWPDATRNELAFGRTLVLERCSDCHGYPRPDEVSRSVWPDTIVRMAKRSNLDAAQTQAVTRYLVSISP